MKVKKNTLLAFRKAHGTELDRNNYMVPQKLKAGYSCRRCKQGEFKKGKVAIG